MTASPPAIVRPFDARMLGVGDGHWIYVEEVGKPGGRPCLFLHGGPGSGAQHAHRALFDPCRDHAILFDQRGAGRSHPYLSRAANTTQHLISDIEAIRTHFGIEKWLIVGGSWGSTLALAYAEEFPQRVSALVLRAIFLGTNKEVEWAFIDGPRTFRPELFAAFRDWLPEDERGDPLAAFLARLNSPDPDLHKPAAHVWNAYERALSELTPANTTLPTTVPPDARVPPTAILEAHYIAHDFFLEDDQLLKRADRLQAIPGALIQGRYDLLCPPATAYALAERWGNAKLQIVDAAGHAISESGIAAAMKAAIASMP